MKRTALIVLSALALGACVDDSVQPTLSTPAKRFDHMSDAASATIEVNNYKVTVLGAAMVTEYKHQTALFNGNFAYGNGPASVFHVNTANGRTDFSSGGLPVEFLPNSHGAALYTSSLFVENPNQALGPKTPLGLTTVRETFSYNTLGDDDYVILRYSITNSTAAAVTGLNVGILADPDFVRATNQATYNGTNQAAEIGVNGTPTSTARHAIVPIGQPVGGYFGWTNGGATPDPSTNAGWWNVIGGGFRPSTVNGDVRQYVGSAPLTINAGETRVFTYALVGGDNASDLAANIVAAKNKAATITGSRPFVSTTVSMHAGAVLYTASATFAAAADAAAFNANDAACGGAPVHSAYVNGNRVDFTFSTIDLDEELRTGDKVICTGRLTNGKYFIGSDTPEIARDVVTFTKLTSFANLDATPTWSPNGLEIAFKSTRNGGGIYVMDATGDLTAIRQVTNNNADLQPDWSPDGQWIYFSRGGAIMRVPANATPATVPTQLTLFQSQTVAPNVRADSDPRVSPDGQTIVFRRSQIAPSGAITTHIWKMTANGELGAGGSPATMLAAGGLQDISPEWSNDGSKIYFSSIRSTGGIFSLDIAIGEPATLVTQDESVNWFQPALSSDGKSIAALSDGKLLLHDMATGQHQVVLFNPTNLNIESTTNVQNMEWQPNASRLMVFANGDIWVSSPMNVVATPVERAQMLTQSVNSLVQDGLISAGDGEQLIQKLDNVAAKVQNGSIGAALNNINAFINKVNALVNSRRMNQVTGEQVTADANALIDQLNSL